MIINSWLSLLKPDFPVPTIPLKSPSKDKDDDDDDDEGSSIYAKIEPYSHPSSPGEGAATVPLLNASNDGSMGRKVYKVVHCNVV
jgi:hypothetical protein